MSSKYGGITNYYTLQTTTTNYYKIETIRSSRFLSFVDWRRPPMPLVTQPICRPFPTKRSAPDIHAALTRRSVHRRPTTVLPVTMTILVPHRTFLSTVPGQNLSLSGP